MPEIFVEIFSKFKLNATMNIIKFVFFIVASTLISFAGVETSLDSLHKTKAGIEFYENTSVYFSVTKLISISKQIYNVNGTEITEVVLDLESSPSQIRIYHIQLPSVKQLKNITTQTIATNIASHTFNMQSAEKELKNANKMAEDRVNITNRNIQLPPIVNKVYPSSTHSKTIEFAIEKKDDIDNLYKKIKSSFTDKSAENKLNGTLFKITK